MKNLLLLALTIGMLVSCSNDDNTTTREASELEKNIKECVDIELANQSNKGTPPPGLTPICDCIQIAIDNYNETHK